MNCIKCKSSNVEALAVLHRRLVGWFEIFECNNCKTIFQEVLELI